ncbi:MAG: hypothetical protein ABFD89_00810 [Bryobacteraceae bacterium]
MAADGKLELVVEVDSKRANASIKSINTGLSSMERAAVGSASAASSGIDGLTSSVTKGAFAGTLLASALERVVGWLKEYGVEAVKYAARTETMTVVTQQLARVNGYEGDVLGRLVERLKELGITTQEAHGVVQRMIFAELDLSKATDLARVAQDAAVLANVNSSEALENIILGITTGQTRLLHNMGLQVSLESVITEGQRKLGRQMSETEKRSAMLNKVLEEGAKIHGSYEAAMGTAGKQMTSLKRYFQEAANAIGQRFMPEFRKTIAALTEGAKWAAENAGAIERWTKIIAAAAVGVAIGKFTTWIMGAKKAVDLLTLSLAKNPFTALAVGATVAVTYLHDAYQESLQLEKQLKEQNKAAADTAKIFYQMERGKSIDDLKRMGYSIEQIRTAFVGAKEGAQEFLDAYDQASLEGQFKVISKKELDERQKEEALELAKEIGKKKGEVERAARDSALASGVKTHSGFAKEMVDMNVQIQKWSTFTDSRGIERHISLSRRAWESVVTEFQNRWAAFKDKFLADNRATLAEFAREHSAAMDERIQRNSDHLAETLQYEREALLQQERDALDIQEQRAGISRDAQLQSLESVNAQTVEQKIALEQRKAEIEVDYLERVHEIKMRLFDLDTSTQAMQMEFQMRAAGYSADEIQARIASLTQQREQIRQANDDATDAAVSAARQNASNQTAQAIRDQNQQIFESLKQQAGGVFDALLTKSQSIWSSIANSFKTAILTAIKDVLSSYVARTLMQLLYGQKVSFSGVGGASGGGGGILGGLGLAATGLGGMSSTAAGVTGATGETGTGGSSNGGILSGLKGGFSGWKDTLTNLGNIGFKPERWSMDEAGNMTKIADSKGVGGLKGGAMLAGGSILAMDGLRRGGWLGVGETTAGGALIGAKFGGPVGAAIGAAVGFGAGIVRLFIKGATEKCREKIKTLYGVDIHDKSTLQSIVDLAKSKYGGNLDMCIRSTDVQELIKLWAMSTGQTVSGMKETMRSGSLIESGGTLHEGAQYENGTLLSSSSSLPSYSLSSGSSGSSSGTVQLNVTLNGEATTSLLQGVTVKTVTSNPRVVQSSVLRATNSSSSRREMTAAQLSPGLLVS